VREAAEHQRRDNRPAAAAQGPQAHQAGSLLKHQTPIRAFADWNEQDGFVEFDLVAHDRGDASGEFCQALTITDVDTGWVQLHGLENKT